MKLLLLQKFDSPLEEYFEMFTMLRSTLALCLFSGLFISLLDEAQAESTATTVSVKRESRGWSGSKNFGVPRFSLREDEVTADTPSDKQLFSAEHSRARMSSKAELPSVGSQPLESEQGVSKAADEEPVEGGL